MLIIKSPFLVIDEKGNEPSHYPQIVYSLLKANKYTFQHLCIFESPHKICNLSGTHFQEIHYYLNAEITTVIFHRNFQTNFFGNLQFIHNSTEQKMSFISRHAN